MATHNPLLVRASGPGKQGLHVFRSSNGGHEDGAQCTIVVTHKNPACSWVRNRLVNDMVLVAFVLMYNLLTAVDIAKSIRVSLQLLLSATQHNVSDWQVHQITVCFRHCVKTCAYALV
eukprot:1157744-Pelagomonas_calceolata.AAC.3